MFFTVSIIAGIISVGFRDGKVFIGEILTNFSNFVKFHILILLNFGASKGKVEMLELC